MKTPLRNALMAAALAVVASVSHAESSITVKDGWAREMPPGTVNTAAYFVLHNHSMKSRTLVGVSADVAEHAELHTTQQVDGAMRMQALEEVNIPSHGMAMFVPGADHIMLIGLKERLTEGQVVELTLTFANGDQQSVSVPVRRGTAASTTPDAAHKHHDS